MVSSWHVPVFRNAATRSRFCIRSVLSALNAAVKLSSARQKRAVFFMAVPIIRNVNLHHGTGQQKKKCPKCGKVMLERIEKNGNKKLYCSNETCENGLHIKKGKAGRKSAKSK